MVRAIVKIHTLRILRSNVHIIITNCVQQLLYILTSQLPVVGLVACIILMEQGADF